MSFVRFSEIKHCNRHVFQRSLNSKLICFDSSEGPELCRNKVGSPKRKLNDNDPVRKLKATFLGKDGQSNTVFLQDNEYILEQAEEQGLDLPCTCRGGICGTCVGRIIEGTVDMSDIPDLTFTLTEEEIEDGMALLCMARATSDVVIETQCDWGYSLGVDKWKGASGTLSAKPEPLMGEKWQE
eukprot:g2053.t1